MKNEPQACFEIEGKKVKRKIIQHVKLVLYCEYRANIYLMRMNASLKREFELTSHSQ